MPPARRRRRRTCCRSSPTDAHRFVGRAHLLRARVGAGADVAVRRSRADPAHLPRPDAPTSCIVAPATAKLIGKYAAGISDDLLTATLLATRAPVLRLPGDAHRDVGAPGRAGQPRDAAPARRASSSNPTTGRLAGGDVGRRPSRRPGRDRRAVRRNSSPPAPTSAPGARGRSCTAGGTREPIDPVRFIGNRSSGKMGHAIADAAAAGGARVVLVTTVGAGR